MNLSFPGFRIGNIFATFILSGNKPAASDLLIAIVINGTKALGFNLTWFAILVAVNLQTAWLSPPVALSAYFLKGVVPEWDLKDIYIGMMQFMVLQIIGLILIIVFPKLVLWLPALIYGQ